MITTKRQSLVLPHMPLPVGVMKQFYPPPAGAVLYLPGYPPGGSTIYDRSNVFYDSAINTNEELDDSETGVDVTPDATTAIPVGSVIRIESEQMLVSATGVTLTVSRGYNGTTPATHATATDIYRLTTNHGTITGAGWKFNGRIWYLDFDGTDDIVTVADAASLRTLFGTPGGTILAWINPDSDGELDRGAICAKFGNWVLRTTNEAAGYVKLTLGHNRDGTSGVWVTTNAIVPINTWSLVGVAYNDADVANDPVFFYNDTVPAVTESSIPVGAVTADTGGALTWGDRSNSDSAYDGKIGLEGLLKATLWTAAQTRNWYQQTRHLFGV